MFDFAVLAIGRADQADRITAVALNFEMKWERFASNGHQISTLNSNNQAKRHNVWLQMKYKMAANQALKRFSRQIIKEDACKQSSRGFVPTHRSLGSLRGRSGRQESFCRYHRPDLRRSSKGREYCKNRPREAGLT